MNKVEDLRQRREALQTQLGALRDQQERASHANSFALSRQRAGVTHLDESEMKEFADDAVTREPAITDTRRQIELIDDELARNEGAHLTETGRRVLGWLRK
jgi:hypothetical protein